MYSDIVQTIQEGSTSYQALQDKLMVGTGCNSCVQEVHDILKEQNS
ncbi:MAG TPA: (2Fe-2S)-binding protein [Candidatus Limnocylindria bacterium]|nr:(2Fe-2S)-binding protein [Candidatus Limnocylindria bacterium]